MFNITIKLTGVKNRNFNIIVRKTGYLQIKKILVCCEFISKTLQKSFIINYLTLNCAESAFEINFKIIGIVTNACVDACLAPLAGAGSPRILSIL